MKSLNVVKTGGVGKTTATAGTAIRVLIRGYRGLVSRLSKFAYTPAATSHVLTALRPLGKTTVAVVAAAAQAVVTVTGQPTAGNDMAANDLMVFEKSDGTQHLGVISSVAAAGADGSVAVTLTANVPTGGFAVGSKVWHYGVVGDGHPQYDLATGAQRVIGDEGVGVIGTEAAGDPMILSVDNATNAGLLDYASYCWLEPFAGGSGVHALAPEGSEGGESGPTLYIADDEDYPEGHHQQSDAVHAPDPQSAGKAQAKKP